MGRFEFVASPDEGKPDEQEKPARLAPENPAALQIEQTVVDGATGQVE